jgi:hypothetical protein
MTQLKITMALTTRILRRTEFTFLAALDNGRERVGIYGMASQDIDRVTVPAGLDDDAFDDFVSAQLSPRNSTAPRTLLLPL